MMTREDLKPIIGTYYDALEDGKVLGRRCTRCGHIEFPPYLCCNTCGCLDTEWIDLSDVRGTVGQVLPTVGAFGDPDFRKAHGDYWAAEIRLPGADPVNSSILHVDYEKLPEFTEEIHSGDVTVKPLIIQDEDVKVLVWQLEDGSPYKKMPELKTADKKDDAASAGSEGPVVYDIADDAIAQTVIACAAEAYGADPAILTMNTDIREDLSNESMKMIVMISAIEDELDATIEIQEAGLLNTLGDFTNKVKEILGIAVSEFAAAAVTADAAGSSAASGETDPADDEIAQTVIACAAEAYGADPADLTLQTDIRNDLSNESMKMIVMISAIEDELDATIEIQEAGLLNTLADFTNKVKEILGE